MADDAVPLVVIDKIDRADWPEETLFHLFNRCDGQSGGLLILSEQPIAQMHWDLADLRSRMRGVAMASIALPDDALVYALLDKYFTDRQMVAPQAMLTYLLGRMERSFYTIQTIAAALDRQSIADKKPLSVALARLVLQEM
jgi:chromosomal replication initiation ATPase DnaA